MIGLLQQLERRSQATLIAAGLVTLLLIGLIDYLTGYEMLFSVFYLLVVTLAAWFVSKGFGLFLSVLSVGVWIGGDLAAGAHYANPLVPVWNAVILMGFYFIVVYLVARLRSFQADLEIKVQQRTVDLTREMTERQRLEEEILKVSEREQQNIGHDLHDGLCQHLTGTALAGQVLVERLVSKSMPEASDAKHVVDLVEEGIDLARSVARGLYPVEMEAEGLMAAFQALATNITNGTKVLCVFECASPVLIHNDAAATHLYRIAQEALRNAIRHGKPKRIGITLSERDGLVTLTVDDDGVGLPETPQPTEGLGIRIMAHRAAMIGGSFAIEPAPTGGTIVTCSFSQLAATGRNSMDNANDS